MNGTPRQSRRALVVTLVVGLPLSAVFLWLSVRGADLAVVWRTVDSARPAPLIGTLGFLALMYWFQAVRWRRIAKAELPRRSVYGMVIAALAVNNIVPGRIGDLLRANWISRATHVSGGKGLATVVVDRGGDLIVLMASLVVCLPLVAGAPWVDRLVVGAVVVAAVFLGLLVGARVYMRRRPGRTNAQRGLVRRLAHDTIDGLSEPMGRVDVAVAMALSVGAWLAWSCSAILCGRSIGIEITPAEALFLAGAVNLGVAVPSSPGFVGTYQWLVVSTLALYGIGQDESLAFAVVFQACWYIPTTLVGGVLLARRMPTRVRLPTPTLPPSEQNAAAGA